MYNLRELGLALLTSSWGLARFWGLVSNKMSSPGPPGSAHARSRAAAARRVQLRLLPYRNLRQSDPTGPIRLGNVLFKFPIR